MFVSTVGILVATFILFRYFTGRKPQDLDGKIVLITGAAQGIGKQQALLLAQEGAKLILWDIREDLLINLIDELKEISNVEHHFSVCDVSKIDQIRQNAQEILTLYSKIDILINNAGIIIGKSFTEISEEEIKKTFEVNVLSQFFIIKQFLPSMIEANEGHIVNIGSQASFIGNALLTEYCSSKFAVFGMNESLRRELRKYRKNGVNMTIVCPGYINTGLFNGFTQTKIANLINPPSDEIYVAQRIINAIKTREREVFIPSNGKLSFLFRFLFSADTLDWLNFVLGGESLMDNFRGRK